MHKATIPDLLRAEWLDSVPIDVALRAYSYRWRCSTCSHEWEARLNDRIATLARSARRKSARTGCPGCHQVHKRGPLPAHIVAEWDEPTFAIENASRDWREQRRYWWKCAVGHRWIASLYRRLTKKTGCGQCKKGKRCQSVSS